MNIFDVIGPVMIGPSSSHTAGAVRLSLLAISILGAWPVKAQIALHGSFAQTYRGHGTDMALLAGLMGWLPDDARIPQAMDFAQKQGLEYEFSTINLGDLTHPNTVYFKLTAADGRQCEVIGSSIGGGQVLVTSIDGAAVELSGSCLRSLPCIRINLVLFPWLAALWQVPVSILPGCGFSGRIKAGWQRWLLNVTRWCRSR